MTSNSTTSVRSLPFWWRVTRYDPARRDDRGAYRGDTWTSVSDVGAEFDGELLTLAEYERVEAAYVEAFASFAVGSDVERLEIRGLEIGDDLKEGAIVSLDEAREIVRRMLREEVICKLEDSHGRFALHVGFDLYMYVGSERSCLDAIARSRALGLFVEGDSPSPQLSDAE